MKSILYLILTILFSMNLVAKENGTLKGRVLGIDENKKNAPLAGAIVKWQGTATGTYTDKKGEFTVAHPNNSNKIIISYPGYNDDTITIDKSREYIEITLKLGISVDELLVKGQRSGTEVSRASIAKTESITLHGLHKAACCNLSESFETNPSVDVNYSDAVTGAKRIELLGLDGIYTQMLSEKIPSMRGIASSFGLNYVPGPWMESIQISKGAASVSTGYESTTGQINVEYKKPLNSKPFFINLFANEAGRYEGNVNTAYKFSDKLGTLLLLHGSALQNQWDHNADNFLDMPMTTQFNAMNRWFYEGNRFHTNIGVKALYEKREGGQKGFYPDLNPGLFGVGIHTERYEAYGKAGYIMPDDVTSFAGIVTANTHYQNSFFGKRKYIGRQNSFYVNLLMESGFGGGCPEHEGEECTHEDESAGGEHHEHEDNEAVTHENEESEASHKEACEVEDAPHKYSVGFSFQFDGYKENFIGADYNRNESVPGTFLEYTYSGIKDITLIGGIRLDFHNIYGTFTTPRFHLKYQIAEGSTLRASAGKGYRVTNIYAENSGLLSSSREFVVKEKLRPEVAWNYGINFMQDFELFNTMFTFSVELYRTEFENQVVTDLETDPQFAYFYNLVGKSYSNSFQADLNFKPINELDITAAYRLNDVNTTINGTLLQKPLQSRHKAFLNCALTLSGGWIVDLTAQFNGSGRLPNTSSNPVEYRLGDTFPSFMMYNGQITKDFEGWSIYSGVENLLDYRQKNPILAYEAPESKYFDASMIWGPLDGRKIYAGMRLEL